MSARIDSDPATRCAEQASALSDENACAATLAASDLPAASAEPAYYSEMALNWDYAAIHAAKPRPAQKSQLAQAAAHRSLGDKPSAAVSADEQVTEELPDVGLIHEGEACSAATGEKTLVLGAYPSQYDQLMSLNVENIAAAVAKAVAAPAAQSSYVAASAVGGGSELGRRKAPGKLRRWLWRVKDAIGGIITVLLLSLLATALYTYMSSRGISFEDIGEWLSKILENLK